MAIAPKTSLPQYGEVTALVVSVFPLLFSTSFIDQTGRSVFTLVGSSDAVRLSAFRVTMTLIGVYPSKFSKFPLVWLGVGLLMNVFRYISTKG